jgi:hypothetical protein
MAPRIPKKKLMRMSTSLAITNVLISIINPRYSMTQSHYGMPGVDVSPASEAGGKRSKLQMRHKTKLPPRNGLQ